jgi:cell division protein FtsI (penicillin-binding protein 3)
VIGGAVRARVGMTMAAFAIAFVALATRASVLTLIDGEWLAERARRQHTRLLELEPRRGPIVDRAGEALGLTRESVDVFVRPRQVEADDAELAELARLLDLPADFVASQARSSKPYVYLKRRVSPARWARVLELGIAGVGREQTRERVYPRGPLAGHVVGFTNIDGKGIEGIELRFDEELRGEGKAIPVKRDANGRDRMLGGEWSGPLTRVGARVELTLDAGIQHVAEIELENAVNAFAAEAGSAIVIDPRSGEILAMANVPRFDPNEFRRSGPTQWRNRAITDVYEPGSTFKAILAAAALRDGAVAPEEVIDCEGGSFRIGRRTIHDHHRYDLLSFADVIAHSSNIGCAKIGSRLGAERLHGAFLDFGFASRTGIQLPGEVSGLVRAPLSWKPIDVATASFGQGVAVSPLQVASAFAGLGNHGRMMRPFVVRRVVDENGNLIVDRRPSVARQVVEPEVAAAVTDILVRVVEEGTGGQAKVPGFAVAGKTGTSQKVEDGRYHPKDRVASFVGFVPAHDPALAILVVVDTPTRQSTYGGVIAAPVFRRIAEYALGRVGVYQSEDPLRERRPDAAGNGIDDGNGAVARIAAVATAGAAGGSGIVAAAYAPSARYRPAEPAFAALAPLPAIDAMPSYLGLGMRQALLRAHESGWRVRIEGSGYVVSQDPPPGAPEGQALAETGGVLTLSFAVDGVDRSMR